ncbi:protein HID1b isoform X2 [Betta splendens]|uniref:Protein HID1b isoform X2 n=1 Tax=Betta splendens TaxID=158456 RepID=A0A8M1H7E8_BETSP|nr:protein HID1b isoform X2 [Betta splendens]
MGNADTKLHFRKAVIQLTTKTRPVEATDDAFWDQFWAETSTSVQDVFALVPAAEIRAVREESPSNLATLCYKRLDEEGDEDEARPLAESLLLAISDLLFCPDFTVQTQKKSSSDAAEDVRSIDSCELIWQVGVGFAQSPPPNFTHDLNRTELLKLLLTCFSEAMYLPPSSESRGLNPWVAFFCSAENRHALPLFTSLLNVVCAYDPVGYGFPYNHLLFSDHREQLVEQALQILVVTLEHDGGSAAGAALRALSPSSGAAAEAEQDAAGPENLFVNYLSRIHREEDLSFVLKGLAQLLNNPLVQTYLPHSTKKVQFHQELLILFWKFCDFNKKFLFFVLKSSDVLEMLVPILFYLNEARADQSRVGLMHIGVFILLLLSGERNFGVRLNKPYTLRVPMDVPVFTGTHADLLVVIFHKIITSGHQRLQPLFDCLLTIIVNISPYLKSLSMVSANKLLHLLEAFSTPWFLFSNPQNHHLVFFLLEVFNNIIQYQFDGNFNLVYAIIRKRNVFHHLANLPSDAAFIHKALQRKRKSGISRSGSIEESMEGSKAAAPAEPGTLKASLEATPGIDKITEKSQVGEDGTMVAVPHSDCPQAAASDAESGAEVHHAEPDPARTRLSSVSAPAAWSADPDWVLCWKAKLPLQTIMRLLQVLVPQVEKICIDKGLTDESEILKFLQHGTLVGLLPVPHPILIRKYQANAGTAMWFRTYMWGVIYLRNVDPPIWYDTDIRLFEIQRI